MTLSASAGIVSVDYWQVSYPCTVWSFLQQILRGELLGQPETLPRW